MAFSITKFFGGAQYWALAIVVCSIAAGGFGYWKGVSQAEDKLVAAQMEMYNKGVAAQKNFSDHQFAVASADFDKRYAALKKQKDKVTFITDMIPSLVPANPACTVSAAAMKALNDVVGE